MPTSICRISASFALWSFIIICSRGALASDSPPSKDRGKLPPKLAERAWEITDAVLANHVDPPARQQMLLGGIKSLLQAAGLPLPFGLGRRVSEVTSCTELGALLDDCWRQPTGQVVGAQALEDMLLQGLLAPVPGHPHLIPAKERRVVEQIEGNRYVGIHITLGMDDKSKLPTLVEVFKGGPADRAGAQRGDLLEDVDGVDTKGRELRDVVDRLRGEEGTQVRIRVRQPNAQTSRALVMTRGKMPRVTVQSLRERPSGGWEVRPSESDPIGYLRVTEISASTPHELRKLAQELEREHIRALVLDLRACTGRSVHPALLLSDSLLARGTIGRVRTAQREMTYQADSDALFRGWPLAVLINSGTSGTAEWVAAALKDNRRATLIGTSTASATRTRAQDGSWISRMTDVISMVAVGDGSWSIELPTGRLERGDGRFLGTEPPTGQGSAPLRGGSSRPLRPEEIKSGVEPDHKTKSPPGQKPPSLPGDTQNTQWGSPRDEPVQKALELLRKSLQTTPASLL
jgi:carboxyl-terminal processing protease